MPLWFWLNVPAAIVIFAAVAGIPLWMVLRRPDTTVNPVAAQQRQRNAQPQPSAVQSPRPREVQLTH